MLEGPRGQTDHSAAQQTGSATTLQHNPGEITLSGDKAPLRPGGMATVDGGAAKETQPGIGRGRSRRRSVERSMVPTNIKEEVKS